MAMITLQNFHADFFNYGQHLWLNFNLEEQKALQIQIQN